MKKIMIDKIIMFLFFFDGLSIVVIEGTTKQKTRIFAVFGEGVPIQ